MAERILIVEDQALIALSEARMLEKHGFEVCTVGNGEQALETIASDSEISLVLMDIDLGTGMDGTEAARRILQMHQLPIIFLTSHSEKEYVDKVEEISGYGYVLKNSGEFVLVESILMAFKLFAAHRSMQQSEEKYRAAFMTSPDAVNINRLDGLYVDINEGFTSLTGFTRQDVIGKLSSEIDIWVIPEDRNTLVKRLEECGVVENLESVFRCKDGSFKTALMSARLITFDDRPHILSITRDISEKKRSEERLRLALEGSRDGLWDWNLVTDEAFHSDRFATMLGYEPDDLPDTSAAWRDLLHPDDKDAALQRVDDYLTGKTEVYESIFRMKTKEGAYRWISGRGKVVFGDDGTPLRFVGFNTDVTEYKRIEEEARKAKRFLDTISDLAYEADTQGCVTYVNPAVERITGFSVDEITGSSFRPLFREEDQPSLMEVYRRTLEGEVLENTLTFVSGTTCHFTTLPRYDEDGTIIGTFGIARDITEQKHREEELRRSRELFRQMFMQHSAAQLLIDPEQEGRIIEANQAAVDFYGYSMDEFKTMYISEINILGPKEIDRHMQAAGKRLQNRFEFTHRLADGSTKEVEVHSSPITYNDKWVLYSIIRDITERVTAEAKYETIVHTMKANEWIELFNGRDVTGWKPLIVDDPGSRIREQMSWMAAATVDLDPEDDNKFLIRPGEGILVNGYTGRTSNIFTEYLHGDCELHLEFMVPHKSNSGVYFMGKYEIQILDSWGATELRYGTCGGIYARYIDEKDVGGEPPRVNASKPPGEWQTYDIVFRAPTFSADGTKRTNAIFERVDWNGVTVHENATVEGPTRASMPGPEEPTGPLMLQGDHGPVAYRNIRIREL